LQPSIRRTRWLRHGSSELTSAFDACPLQVDQTRDRRFATHGPPSPRAADAYVGKYRAMLCMVVAQREFNDRARGSVPRHLRHRRLSALVFCTYSRSTHWTEPRRTRDCAFRPVSASISGIASRQHSRKNEMATWRATPRAAPVTMTTLKRHKSPERESNWGGCPNKLCRRKSLQ
jgi:hypothetical protein